MEYACTLSCGHWFVRKYATSAACPDCGQKPQIIGVPWDDELRQMICFDCFTRHKMQKNSKTPATKTRLDRAVHCSGRPPMGFTDRPAADVWKKEFDEFLAMATKVKRVIRDLEVNFKLKGCIKGKKRRQGGRGKKVRFNLGQI